MRVPGQVWLSGSRRFWQAVPAGVLLAVAWVLLAGRPALGELSIDITRGVVEPLPVAVVEFAGTQANEREYGRDVARVIAANLERSGLFQPVNPAAFIQREVPLDATPRFGDWRVINAQALVHGRVMLQADGRLQADFRLWDVFAERQMAGFTFVTDPRNWRRVAHIISDAVYKRITGEDGYFDTRIVYVAESGPRDNRVKRLAIMDQDGENHRFLTDGSDLVLTPRFSPTLQEITYLSFHRGRPQVFIYNIDTGRQESIGDFDGLSFAPRFSPDGTRLVMSLSREGNSDIYAMDLRTRQLRRLTAGTGIDTSPSYAPDGRQIVFNSDRGGSQQIYLMDADGGNVRRISFGQGRYATPVWSPRGDLIAFTRMHQGRFFIGVMRPDGSGERLLAEGFRVEGPTWAPNGRVLMYFDEEPTRAGGSGRSRLVSIDLTGRNKREVPTPTDASDPAWSPLIP
ncbi:MAG: Tol-Pal system protein TolB [Rhodospirillales bacterium]|nr:MAG: Tol-Pal system protein TolB [Rhodospirillales bacterium]